MEPEEWVAPTGNPSQMTFTWVPNGDVSNPKLETALGRFVASFGRTTIYVGRSGGESADSPSTEHRCSYEPVARYWYEMIPERVSHGIQAERAILALAPDDHYVPMDVFTYVCEALRSHPTELDIARRFLAMYKTQTAQQSPRELAIEAIRSGFVATGGFPASQDLDEFLVSLHDEFTTNDIIDERLFRRNTGLFKLVHDEFDAVGRVVLPETTRRHFGD